MAIASPPAPVLPGLAASTAQAAARARGLRRLRAGGPCPPPAIVPVPAALTALRRPEALALLARVYDADVAAGRRLSRYDLQAFKSAWALLVHLHRLGQAKPASAHVATSSVQLVRGLAAHIPSWEKTSDRFADRDRHHSWLRRNLQLLVDAKLIELYAGVNDELEHLRTEVMLLEPPRLSEQELRVARAQYQRWTAKHGRDLTTKTTTGIRSLRGLTLSLPAVQRSRRARGRCRQVAQARVSEPVFSSQTAHPFGAALPTAAADKASSGSDVPFSENVWHNRTREGAFAPQLDAGRAASADATAAGQNGGSARRGGVGPAAPPRPSGEFLGAERSLVDVGDASAQVAETRPELPWALLVLAAQRRADQLAGWPASRRCPSWRVVEAWTVARHGALRAIGPDRARAGFIDLARQAQLRRALARWEHYAEHRRPGWPQAPWAALLHAAAVWAAELVIGTIAALDAETKRMRARATHQSPGRQEQATRRARRTLAATDATGPIAGRPPAWVLLDPAGTPVAIDLEQAPPPTDPDRRAWQRRLQLAAGAALPPELHGRQAMTDRTAELAEQAARRREPGPAPFQEPGRPAAPDEITLEQLAAHLKTTASGLARVPAEVLDGLRGQLAEDRARGRVQACIDTTRLLGDELAFRADPTTPARHPGQPPAAAAAPVNAVLEAEIAELARLEELPEAHVRRWSPQERHVLLAQHRRRADTRTRRRQEQDQAAEQPDPPASARPELGETDAIAGMLAVHRARAAQRRAQQPAVAPQARAPRPPRLIIDHTALPAGANVVVDELEALLAQANPSNAWPPDVQARARAAAQRLAAQHAITLHQR